MMGETDVNLLKWKWGFVAGGAILTFVGPAVAQEESTAIYAAAEGEIRRLDHFH
jgi:hypothetical protein